MTRYQQFQEFRTRLNHKILGGGGHEGRGTLVTKRFFALDDQCYRDTSADGGLCKQTKELLGLAASAVLRCDDCIAYHIDQCAQAGVSDEEFFESFDIAVLVGGSIVIPHLRRAVEFLDLTREHLKSP